MIPNSGYQTTHVETYSSSVPGIISRMETIPISPMQYQTTTITKTQKIQAPEFPTNTGYAAQTYNYTVTNPSNAVISGIVPNAPQLHSPVINYQQQYYQPNTILESNRQFVGASMPVSTTHIAGPVMNSKMMVNKKSNMCGMCCPCLPGTGGGMGGCGLNCCPCGNRSMGMGTSNPMFPNVGMGMPLPTMQSTRMGLGTGGMDMGVGLGTPGMSMAGMGVGGINGMGGGGVKTYAIGTPGALGVYPGMQLPGLGCCYCGQCFSSTGCYTCLSGINCCYPTCIC